MKLGHEFYRFADLKSNQKCSVFIQKKPQNSGMFARIAILHSTDRLTPVHEGYNYVLGCARGHIGIFSPFKGEGGHKDSKSEISNRSFRGGAKG